MAIFVIRYRYPGTANGQPVGLVYAQDIGRLSPGCWSYSTSVAEATQWKDRNSAYQELQGKQWPEAQVVEVK